MDKILRHKMWCKSILLTLLCAFSYAQQNRNLVVDVKEGSYRGVTITVDGRSVAAFLGIGYAEPPTGANRWQKTQPVKKFQGVKDARTVKDVCPQMLETGEFVGDEDCLYLDIMVSGGIESNKLKPVVVFLNNYDTFQSGVKNSGAFLARRENLVVVVVNSRLGALGYLYDGPGTGTMGLWDNLEALKWVNQSIAKFGGDPEKITVMGIDSGALIAQLLAISPEGEGLFNQVISMSPLSVDISPVNQEDLRMMIRDMAHCGANQMITCDISSLSAKEIVNSTLPYMKSLSMEAVLNDKELFPEYNDSKIQNYNLMTGTTSAELLKASIEISGDLEELDNSTTSYDQMREIIVNICSAGYSDQAAICLCTSAMENRYNITKSQTYTFRDVQPIFGAYMRSSILHTLEIHAEGNSDSFVYYIDIKEDPEILGITDDENIGSDTSIMLKLAFGYPWLPFGGKFEMLNKDVYNSSLFSGIDPDVMFGGKMKLRSQSQDIMRAISLFSYRGNPSGTRNGEYQWPNYSESKEILAFVENNVRKMDSIPNEDAYDFFNNVYFKSKRCQLPN